MRTRIVLSLGILVAGELSSQVAPPVLKWAYGGCFASWCERGWYASPAAGDLERDGSIEVVASASSIVVLEGATGNLRWRVASGHDRSNPSAANVGRTWPGIVLADLDRDGWLEIATAHGSGWVSVYRHDGYFVPGWPRQPVPQELRSLAAADLDLDGTSELIVSAARSNATNTWVYSLDGAVRSGWPQVVGGGGYAAGVYGSTVAAGDLDRDDRFEVIVPSDVHYVCAYRGNGASLVPDAIFSPRNWGQVGFWESAATELRGWGLCNGVRAESYRTNFADGPASLEDLDGDGEVEIAVTGATYDCSAGGAVRYTGLYLIRPDRRRFANGLFDWTNVPVDLGAPLSLDWNVIETASPAPVLADLDGDGILEILFADLSGKVHAFWLDRSPRGSWPFSAYNPAEGFYRFASEPVVVDLDRDGFAEVLLTSWTQKGSNANGSLYVLSWDGLLLHQVVLPPARGSATWNGALAAPTLAEIDGDADLEILIQTAYSGVVAYDLPGSAGARVHWGTGRGSYSRRGVSDSGRTIFRNGFENGSTAAWSLRVP